MEKISSDKLVFSVMQQKVLNHWDHGRQHVLSPVLSRGELEKNLSDFRLCIPELYFRDLEGEITSKHCQCFTLPCA